MLSRAAVWEDEKVLEAVVVMFALAVSTEWLPPPACLKETDFMLRIPFSDPLSHGVPESED